VAQARVVALPETTLARIRLVYLELAATVALVPVLAVALDSTIVVLVAADVERAVGMVAAVVQLVVDTLAAGDVVAAAEVELVVVEEAADIVAGIGTRWLAGGIPRD